MTMKQEYDTKYATMTFGEEEIDWQVMNVKMTIDRTGKQHPTWIYTPLYTKGDVTPNLAAPGDHQCIIQPHPADQVEEREEYESISKSVTFDVEEAQWNENEAFRLTFDPTGKRNPQIQLLIMRKVTSSQLARNDTTDTMISSEPAKTVAREPSPSPSPEPELWPIQEITPYRTRTLNLS